LYKIKCRINGESGFVEMSFNEKGDEIKILGVLKKYDSCRFEGIKGLPQELVELVINAYDLIENETKEKERLLKKLEGYGTRRNGLLDVFVKYCMKNFEKKRFFNILARAVQEKKLTSDQIYLIKSNKKVLDELKCSYSEYSKKLEAAIMESKINKNILQDCLNRMFEMFNFAISYNDKNFNLKDISIQEQLLKGKVK